MSDPGSSMAGTEAILLTAGPPKLDAEARHGTAGPPTGAAEAIHSTAGPPTWGEKMSGLRTCGEALADAIKARISVENRVERGGAAFALQGKPLVDGARKMEDSFRVQLMDEYRHVVPENIRDWAAQIPGLASGELFPRIIAVIGHPRHAIPYHWEGGDIVPGIPYSRSLRQFWQWAGCGDPDMVPRSDVLGHSPTREEKLAAGKRTQLRPLLYTFSSYLLRSHTRSEAVANSRYWQVFTKAKAEAQEKKHHRQCQNKKRPPLRPNGCGTVLHPEWGAPGTPWRPGHALMHAHRMVHKEFLRDLWVVAGQ